MTKVKKKQGSKERMDVRGGERCEVDVNWGKIVVRGALRKGMKGKGGSVWIDFVIRGG